MQLHLISYQHIGPFEGYRSVVFQPGKFLIQAPIGSGKSFLFFDGPLFALYKYSSRPLLNKKADHGRVSLVFSVQGEYYLIDRQLKHGKSKDRVQSTLYLLPDSAQVQQQLASYQGDQVIHSEDVIGGLTLTRDEITTKSDTEVQGLIEGLIPPREVLSATQFLLQDSDNIFAMTPADRITIFKNIFNLIAIDHAKDKISERRREVQSTIRVMEDTSTADTQLQRHMQQLLTTYEKIAADHRLERLEERQTLQSIGEHKRSIQGYDPQTIDSASLDQLYERLQSQRSQLQQQQALAQQRQQQLQQLTTQKNTLTTTQSTLQSKLQQTPDPAQLQQLSVTKQTLTQTCQDIIQQLTTLRESMDRAAVADEFDAIQSKVSADQRSPTWLAGSQDRETLHESLTSLRAYGTLLRERCESLRQQSQLHDRQLQSIDTKLADLALQPGTSAHDGLLREQQRLQETLVAERTRISELLQQHHERQQSYQQQLTQLQQRQKSLSKDVSAAQRFACSKINADCPFVEQIASGSMQKFVKQQQLIEQQITEHQQSWDQQQRDDRQQQLMTDRQQVSDRIQQLSESPEQQLTTYIEQLQQQRDQLMTEKTSLQQSSSTDHATQLQQAQETMMLLATGLQRLGWKQLDQDYQTYRGLLTRQQESQQQLTQLQTRENALQQQLNQTTADQARLEETIKQLTQLDQEIKQLTQQTQQQPSMTVQRAKQLLDYVGDMQQSVARIHELIEQQSASQLQLKQLKLDEQRTKNLYHIFSKELMYVVLEDTLPVLFDVINAYLTQVVDYVVHFALEKTSSDKLELEVSVTDSHGTRPISSLSGGQKVVLKLAWILAIVSYTQGSSLFLDETINNLDEATISSVATMLEDFVRQRDIKLYVVTHSQQIQQMEIWDGVVRLG